MYMRIFKSEWTREASFWRQRFHQKHICFPSSEQQLCGRVVALTNTVDVNPSLSHFNALVLFYIYNIANYVI